MTDATIAPAPLGVRDVLRLRNYRLLWTGQLISEAGDGLTNLTLLLLVNALTGSTAALAAMAIVLAIPPLTIGLVAGTYVDRIDRRRIMLISDGLRAVLVLGFIAVGSRDSLWLLYVLAFVQASIGTFFTPARSAILPRTVPTDGLLAANSLSQATRVVSGIVGSALAGLIVGVLGAFWPAFVLDSASFAVSFLLISRLPVDLGRIEGLATRAAGGVRSSLGAGLRTIAGSRVLSTTILALAVAMLGLGAVNVLFVPFVVRELQVGPVWLGPVELAQSASMILASGMITVLARRFAPNAIVSIGMAGLAVIIALAAGVTEVWQLLVLMFAIGWFLTPLQASVITILQTSTPDGERGRVMSVLQAGMSGASVLSMGFAGIAGDAFGVRNVFLIAGAIAAVGCVVSVVGYRGLRHLAGRPSAAAASLEGTDARAADTASAPSAG
jgi:MFS family permease